MSFIEDIHKIQAERITTEQDVIDEILDYFNNRYNDEEYEKWLKKRIVDKIENSKRTLMLKVEFWEYHSGCSPTHIESGGVLFEIPYSEIHKDNYCYKGIKLVDIQEKLCDKISSLLVKKLRELGLTIVSETRHDNEYRFDYYEKHIVISW